MTIYEWISGNEKVTLEEDEAVILQLSGGNSVLLSDTNIMGGICDCCVVYKRDTRQVEKVFKVKAGNIINKTSMEID